MSNEQLEQEIVSKGLTAPRVTLADLEANIMDTEIVKHVSKTGQVLRWAVLTTKNGFAVVGKPSCSASKENDNAEIGEKIAISNSKDEMWPLMGYELKSQLILKDLLSSARAIAERKGADTAWERFSARIAELGISGITAKVFKVLPSDNQ